MRLEAAPKWYNVQERYVCVCGGGGRQRYEKGSIVFAQKLWYRRRTVKHGLQYRTSPDIGTKERYKIHHTP